MNDDDLIRRGDAVLAVTAADKECLGANGAREFIRALPAALDVAPTANCVICGRLVDTREKAEGGDGHGCEYPEGWVCSDFCAENLHPDPDWMVEGMAALDVAPAPEPVYVVWSNEHKAWWGPDHCGYRAKLADAGRYTRDEALKICRNARGGREFRDNPSEVPLLLDDASWFWGEDRDEWRAARRERADRRRRDHLAEYGYCPMEDDNG